MALPFISYQFAFVLLVKLFEEISKYKSLSQNKRKKCGTMRDNTQGQFHQSILKSQALVSNSESQHLTVHYKLKDKLKILQNKTEKMNIEVNTYVRVSQKLYLLHFYIIQLRNPINVLLRYTIIFNHSHYYLFVTFHKADME